MISIDDAIKLIKKNKPGKKITEGFELDRYYVFCVPSGTDVDYNSPYYAVEKSTGKIVGYSPLDDLDRFNNARMNHRIILK